MPRIPKRLPFSRRYTAPEGQMYKLPEDRHIPSMPMLDDRRGYTIGSAGIENPRWEGKPVLPIQGPRLPDNVERARQAYLDALEDYREVMNEMAMEQAYNRKAMAWNDYIGRSPTMRRAISSGKFDEWNRYFNEPDYPRRPEFGEEIKSFEDFPDEWSHIPWREWK